MRPREATELPLLLLRPSLRTKRHYEKVRKAFVYKRPSTDFYRHMETVCSKIPQVRKNIPCLSKLKRPQLKLKTQFSPVSYPKQGYAPFVLYPARNLHMSKAPRYVSHIVHYPSQSQATISSSVQLGARSFKK